jgi:hypothetical protein
MKGGKIIRIVSHFGFMRDRINVDSDYRFCTVFTIDLNECSLTDLSQMTQGKV